MYICEDYVELRDVLIMTQMSAFCLKIIIVLHHNIIQNTHKLFTLHS